MGLFGDGGLFGSGLLGDYSGGIIRDKSKDMKIFKDVIKESNTLVGELFRTIDDAKDEFHELCTDGFVEMVIKGNKDYKTSFEIKEEADEKISGARYKYQKRCHKFNKYLEKLNTKINYLYRKKSELANEINQEVRRLPNMTQIPEYTTTPSYSYKPSTIGMICDYSGLGKVLDVKRRKDSANEYLEDAKDFEVEIYGKIAEINRVQAFLDTINMNLDEEEMIITALSESLRTKKKFVYNKISEQLHILISEYILDPSGKKNEKYLQAVEQLKRMG